MSRIVRSSKYRHVFGTPNKKENCYDNLKVTRSAWDSNFVCASRENFSVIWESGGGGAVAVINYKNQGKVSANLPLITGHKAPVLDQQFNPFNESLLATASEDAYVKIWQIPREGMTKNMDEPVQTLSGHKRKVGTTNFHPTSSNVLATSSTDFSVKVWDIEKGEARSTVEGHGDIINAVSWNYDGSQMATVSKDKKLRLIDPRAGTPIIAEAEAHQGVKGSRVIWLGRKNKLFTVGFNKTSEREYSIWDPANMAAPVLQATVDSSSGVIMPFYDDDTSVLFLAGKGDGNIRYYEIVDENPYIHFLSEYKSATPQRGLCPVPKLAVDVNNCEIVRFLKLAGTLCEPISFVVPRKGSDAFQDDLYPDTPGPDAAQSADDYFSGKNVFPTLVSMAPGFQPKAKEVDFNPVAVKTEEVLSEKELREAYEKQKNRIAYLEAELLKRDAHIKDLEARK
jgi:coronin-1B/1C/6